jgi:hypothetical protein
MSNKHKDKHQKKHKKHKEYKKNTGFAGFVGHKQLKELIENPQCEKCEWNESSLYTSDTNTNHMPSDKHDNPVVKPVFNSYPVGMFGYDLPNASYSVQKIRRPDDNKYFHNYRYNYNVQVNKPILTYDNFIAQRTAKNMTAQEQRYYAKMNEKYYYYNGNYEIDGDKQNVVALQANLNYPMYMGGPAVGEINGQAGYTPQPTKSAPNVNPYDTYINTNGIQVYGNSPAYYGVQSKTLPGENLMYTNPNNTPNPKTGYNPAYSNYGQYYY